MTEPCNIQPFQFHRASPSHPLRSIDNSILHHKIANSLDRVTEKKFEATRKRKRSINEYTDDSDDSDLDLRAQDIEMTSKSMIES